MIATGTLQGSEGEFINYRYTGEKQLTIATCCQGSYIIIHSIAHVKHVHMDFKHSQLICFELVLFCPRGMQQFDLSLQDKT